MKCTVLAAATVSVLAGCGPGGYANPWYPAYPAPAWGAPMAQMPAPTTSGAPAPAPAAASAPAPPPGHDLPEKPGPFAAFQGVTLGMSHDEVAARAPGLLERRTTYSAGFSVELDRDNRVQAMMVYFERPRTEELTSRWGEPRTEGELTAWYVDGEESRVVLVGMGYRLRIERYFPLPKLITGDGGKLGGVVADVLGMDRKAFDARFPHPIVHKLVRDVVLEVPFPPAETSSESSDIEAQFTPSGAQVAVELNVSAEHSTAIQGALRAAYGEPKRLTLCKRKGEPCEIAGGVYQADPILRYRGASPEVTLWPGGYGGKLTARWSRVPTRSDHFTTMSKPQ